jgi:hypothetical protein
MQFEMSNIPRSQNLGDGTCCMRYLYRFINVLPDRDTMNSLAKQLEYKFTFAKEVYKLPEDVDIDAWVTTERLNDYEAIFVLSENEPDESVIFMYGIHSLPVKIEKVFGTVESIQGDSREMWIKSARQY